MGAPGRYILLAALTTAVAASQPAGLVLSATGGLLLRSGAQLPLQARAGDILFPGDVVAAQESASVLFCPEKAILSLQAKTEVLVEQRQLRVRAGALAPPKPVGSCFLPTVDRTSIASQQHYGASLVRAVVTTQPGLKLPTLPEAQQKAILAELPPESDDPVVRIARAAVFEKHDLRPDAAQEYRKLAQLWPDAAWVHSRLFELENERPAAANTEGKTYALLVGVSKYRSEQVPPLRFAHQDAEVFEQFLKSPRGGSIPPENITVLTNEAATTAAIRNAFETFLKVRAGPNDTVILLLAGHGVAEPERGAFLVTYDSDPQDLAATALPMADVNKLVREDLANVGRVMAYVDACRSATIGTIASRTNSLNSSVERLQEAEGELFLFTASRAKEVSFEGEQFGGGHGAFSYFLLSGLSGEADRNQDQTVDLNELIEYVRAKVAEGTMDRQHPRDFGSMETTHPLADVNKDGIQIAKWTGLPQEPQLLALAAAPGGAPGIARALDLPARAGIGLDAAIAAGKILPRDADGAFTVLARLRGSLAPDAYLLEENKLRVELENRGQQVLLRYLTGDQIPQSRSDFAAGAEWFDAALQLTPESMLLRSRKLFCDGRTKLFDKQYDEASQLLERAVRFDPAGAYSYNALGIAYLEQADYDRAIAAFRDAIRLAPYWAYPIHNLALAHAERGNYDEAVRAYQRAMKLAPRYSYLPYNLGLVYQRMNRRKDAEAAYRKAIDLTPDRPEPYNALGFLKASAGRREEAERLYHAALEKDAEFLSARHNLAVLLAEEPVRAAEAIQLWREALAKEPEYLPSILSLARALARTGDTTGAVSQFETAVRLRPDYVAARLALAELYQQAGRTDAALDQLNQALKRQPRGSRIFEAIGDLHAARGSETEAEAAYRSAIEYAPDGGERKRIGRKLKGRT
ncbi:MAG: tetratricopeptide repeat protein [Bryobacteraceae bacterium]|nr:tetratricopeptide repeat protein [Bryobacteraceae bacterium]